jgi:hypothetical protein
MSTIKLLIVFSAAVYLFASTFLVPADSRAATRRASGACVLFGVYIFGSLIVWVSR